MNSQRNSYYYHGLRGAASATAQGKHPASPSLHHRYAFLQQVAPPEPTYPYPEAEYLLLESDTIEVVAPAASHNSSSLYSDNWQLQEYLPLPLHDSDAFYPSTLATTPLGLDQLKHLLQSDQPEPQSYNMFGFNQNTFALGEIMPNPISFESHTSVDDVALFGTPFGVDTYDDTSAVDQILTAPVSTSSGHVDSSFPWTSEWTSEWTSDCSSALLGSVSPMWSSASPNISELSVTGSPLIPSVSCPSSWDPNVKDESFAPVKTEFASVKIEQFDPNFKSVIKSHIQNDALQAKRKTEDEPEMPKKAKKAKKLPTAHPCTFEGCSRVFDRKSNLGSHLATHYNVREHHCNECDSSFLRVYDLDRHIRSHTKEIKYPCTHKGCTKGYGRSDQLKRHLEKNH
ncbi:hypothetical protein BGZ93_007557 [Podila epicladia]|nr:hypothetical protein BGZ92_005238 [Podila epicladia]KAG0099450.1 hypothetical protein BGZ93_007557 [Podila epicladia]